MSQKRMFFTLGIFILSVPLVFAEDSTPRLNPERLKVVIFTAPFGAGHDTAAKTVKTIIQQRDPSIDVVIKNALDFAPPVLGDFGVKANNVLLADYPGIYSFVFNQYVQRGNDVKSIGDMPVKHVFDNEKTMAFLKEQRPSVIIDTWPIMNDMIVHLKEKGQLPDIPVLWVHTDSVASKTGAPQYFEKAAMKVTQAYVPNSDVRDTFVKNGVPADRVQISGMPVILKPRPPLTEEQRLARKLSAREKVSIPASQHTFMIEGGKGGLGNYPMIIGSLAHASGDEPITIVAACGVNEQQMEEVNWLTKGVGDDQAKARVLEKRLKPLLKLGVSRPTLDSWIKNGLPKRILVKPLGFTQLGDWRFASDAVITKPGGLSTSEMAAEGIPMVLRAEKAPGQEQYNVDDLTKSKLAVAVKNEDYIGQEALKVAKDTKFLKELAASSEEYRKNFNLAVIAQDAIALANSHTVLRPDMEFRESSIKRCLLNALGMQKK